MLNAGEVPNLFANDEKAQICETCAAPRARTAARATGRRRMYAYFVARCREQLHIVPRILAHRRRLPHAAAHVPVARQLLHHRLVHGVAARRARRRRRHVPRGRRDGRARRQRTVEMCKIFHETVARALDKFARSERAPRLRDAHLVPRAHQTFQTLLARKRRGGERARERYDNGLEQLAPRRGGRHHAGGADDLQPELIKAKAETEEMQVHRARSAGGIEPRRRSWRRRRREAGWRGEAKGMKEECEADLAEAIPALNAAVAALDTLKKADIDEVKSMGKPPAGVKLTLEAVCVMKDVKPEKVKDPTDRARRSTTTGARQEDADGRQAFVERSRRTTRTTSRPRSSRRSASSTCRTRTSAREVAKASTAARACASGCAPWRSTTASPRSWRPRRRRSRGRGEYAEAMEALAVKQAELKEVDGQARGAAGQARGADEKKADLERQVDDCDNKLERAEKLIDGLGGEKARWSEIAASSAPSYDNLLGDVLVSAGVIAYLGPFTDPLPRASARGSGVACARSGSRARTSSPARTSLGDPVAIREWNMQGLPTDSFSIDNGIIVVDGAPLAADDRPAGAGQQVGPQHGGEDELHVIKLTQATTCARSRTRSSSASPCCCENVLEELDPALEPLLVKQTFKQGGVECIRLGDATIEYSSDFRSTSRPSCATRTTCPSCRSR